MGALAASSACARRALTAKTAGHASLDRAAPCASHHRRHRGRHPRRLARQAAARASTRAVLLPTAIATTAVVVPSSKSALRARTAPTAARAPTATLTAGARHRPRLPPRRPAHQARTPPAPTPASTLPMAIVTVRPPRCFPLAPSASLGFSAALPVSLFFAPWPPTPRPLLGFVVIPSLAVSRARRRRLGLRVCILLAMPGLHRLRPSPCRQLRRRRLAPTALPTATGRWVVSPPAAAPLAFAAAAGPAG